ncbi:colicin V production CvpA [Rhodobacter veldkampii DSM 11550]|uniref:Colicin V production CvpA n=1 Tax=Phaeovulum veldkampii DSM 11550 TaxID=1185920 RepID=A0A2T4JK97_9RHOB|nr:CvpA family protein [Phaeovulum veldkampii]MBK5945460.1 colicin V production CvpA [Phaeovulum veldkampii DSM 11550]NCU19821.1 CvpA family protein [Candidatus Falkowbacteria bacterium]PTE18326.1 colicin V production CvpA [Phaeovulum veldkampii DSM 11550]TDQ57805.1 membrane protein required for colicin V production [Phaeovulum veldkampii DSM 11550]
MDGFTIIDAIVAGVIILSAILAYSRGFVREGLSIAGWIAAAVLAYMFADAARPLIAQIPVLNEFLADSCELSMIAGFAAIFALALVVFSIITPLFSSVVQGSALGGVDQALGFLFGVARGVVLVAVAFVVFDRVAVDGSFPIVDASRSAKVFSSVQGNMNAQIPEDAPGWIVSRYENLVSKCATPAAAPLAAPAN